MQNEQNKEITQYSLFIEILKWISYFILIITWILIGTLIWIWLLVRAWTSCTIGNLIYNLTGSGRAINMQLLSHAIAFWFNGFISAKEIAFGNPQIESQPVIIPFDRLLIESIFTIIFWAITICIFNFF